MTGAIFGLIARVAPVVKPALRRPESGLGLPRIILGYLPLPFGSGLCANGQPRSGDRGVVCIGAVIRLASDGTLQHQMPARRCRTRLRSGSHHLPIA